MTECIMKIEKTLRLKEVAKARDKLIKKFKKERDCELLPDELLELYDSSVEDIRKSILDFCIMEIEEFFDFDGEENYD